MNNRSPVPTDWPRTPLGDVTSVVAGSTPSTAVREFWDGDVVWVTPTDMGKLQGGTIRGSGRRISKQGFAAASLEMVPAGSVVLSTRAPIGHLGLAGVRLCTNQGCKVFVPSASILGEYLLYALQVAVPRLKALGSGTTFTEVSKADLEDFTIPLPPFPVQRRIAGILGQADRLRRMRRYALELSDQFLPALFLRMFGDGSAGAKRVPYAQLEELCDQVVDCPHSTPVFAEMPTRHPCVRSSDLQRGYLDLSTAKYVDHHQYVGRIARAKPTAGDVLYCREGERYGNAARVPLGASRRTGLG
jgi:type I restriction enzyme, S subunit